MQKRSISWIKSIILFSALIIIASSFIIKEETKAIVCHHERLGAPGYLLIISRADLDYHLSHGDTEIPYSDELAKKIIGAEEEGAGIACN